MANKPKWEEDPTAFSGLQCNFELLCPFGHGHMDLFDVKFLNFDVGNPDKVHEDKDNFLIHPSKTLSHAVDVAMFCMDCGYHDIFGVAIDYNHSLRNYKNLKGHIKEMSGKDADETIRELAEERTRRVNEARQAKAENN